jgi:hypothetical protein
VTLFSAVTFRFDWVYVLVTLVRVYMGSPETGDG